MSRFPIAIQAFVTMSGDFPSTFYRNDYTSGSWGAATKIFDSTPNEATFRYNISAGETEDGTNLGITLGHSTPDASASTLEFIGDGLPDAPIDISNSSLYQDPAQDTATGAWLHNGHFYKVAIDSQFNVYMLKSANANPTSPSDFSVVDPAGSPSGTVPSDFTTVTAQTAIRKTGSKVDLVCFNNAGGGNSIIFIYTFDLDADTWSGIYGRQVISGFYNVLNSSSDFPFADAAFRFSNGNIATIANESIGHTEDFLVYASGTWTKVTTNLFPGADGYTEGIVDPSNIDQINIFTSDGVLHNNTYFYYTLSSTGVLSSVLFSFPPVTATFGPFGHGIVLDGTLWFPLTDSDINPLNRVFKGTPGGTSFTATFLPAPSGSPSSNGGTYMVDWVGEPPPIMLEFNLHGAASSGLGALLVVNPPTGPTPPGPITNPTECINQQ